MAKARAVTGIDIVDASVEEGLTILLHSLNTEAQLNERGAASEEQRLLRLLCNRLRMLRDFQKHPEIADQKIFRPLFIVGGPRTGSTKLHKMLAASGDFIYLPFWQAHCLSLRTGEREEDPTPRIREAEEYVQWMNQFAPQAQLNHAYGTLEPEEEALIVEHSFGWTFPTIFAEVPSYTQWWTQRDFREQAEFLKRGLQYLQWQFHDGDTRAWLLKGPAYSGVEPVLAAVFTEARFVSTHRHPAHSVPSTANLVNGYRESCSDTDWRRSLGTSFCEGLAVGTELNMAVRDNHPELRILDISYTTLTRHADQVAESIYAHLGMPLSPDTRQRMTAWDKANPAPKQEAKTYSRADYALTEEMINARFGRYIDRFKAYF